MQHPLPTVDICVIAILAKACTQAISGVLLSVQVAAGCSHTLRAATQPRCA